MQMFPFSLINLEGRIDVFYINIMYTSHTSCFKYVIALLLFGIKLQNLVSLI